MKKRIIKYEYPDSTFYKLLIGATLFFALSLFSLKAQDRIYAFGWGYNLNLCTEADADSVVEILTLEQYADTTIIQIDTLAFVPADSVFNFQGCLNNEISGTSFKLLEQTTKWRGKLVSQNKYGEGWTYSPFYYVPAKPSGLKIRSIN